MWILHLFTITAQICPFFSRKHVTAQNYCKYRYENRECLEKMRIIPTCTRTAQKMRPKNGKKGQKGWKLPGTSIGLSKQEFLALIKKLKLIKYYFEASVIKNFFKWKNNINKNSPKFKQNQIWIMWFLEYLAQLRFQIISQHKCKKRTKRPKRHPA